MRAGEVQRRESGLIRCRHEPAIVTGTSKLIRRYETRPFWKGYAAVHERWLCAACGSAAAQSPAVTGRLGLVSVSFAIGNECDGVTKLPLTPANAAPLLVASDAEALEASHRDVMPVSSQVHPTERQSTPQSQLGRPRQQRVHSQLGTLPEKQNCTNMSPSVAAIPHVGVATRVTKLIAAKAPPLLVLHNSFDHPIPCGWINKLLIPLDVAHHSGMISPTVPI